MSWLSDINEEARRNNMSYGVFVSKGIGIPEDPRRKTQKPVLKFYIKKTKRRVLKIYPNGDVDIFASIEEAADEEDVTNAGIWKRIDRGHCRKNCFWTKEGAASPIIKHNRK